MKYRLGNKQKRVILDDKGHVVCTIEKDHRHLSNVILNALNGTIKNEGLLAEKDLCPYCGSENVKHLNNLNACLECQGSWLKSE